MKKWHTVVGLHQDTSEPFVVPKFCASADEAVVRAVEECRRAGNAIADLVIVAVLPGSRENLLDPRAFPAEDALKYTA